MQQPQVDHIILGVKNLASGVQQFESLTGIKPIYGGGHPNGDTHNAIVALTGGMYIEILAPRDDLDSIPAFFAEMKVLTPLGFAISVNDMERFMKNIDTLGFQTNGIEEGSRKKPNGQELQWKLLIVNKPQFIMNPFFIHWSKETEHPSVKKDIQASLTCLQLATPYQVDIERILGKNVSPLSLSKLTSGEKPKIIFTLQTPKGMIPFGE